MKKLLSKTLVSGLCACAVLSMPVVAQDVEIRATDLGGGVYMMTGSGGNLGLSVGDDGAFLIDDQFAPLSDKIKAAIAEVSGSPVRFLVNTHWHGDHTGGNANFANDGAIIVAHKNVRKRLTKDHFIEAINYDVKASAAVALPVITFAKEINFYQNGQSIHILHVENAHTDGDALIYFEEADVLHMGDTFFNKSYPFIDTSTGGSINGVIAAHERALAIITQSTKIIPGHGVLANRADLQNNLAMLKEVRSKILKTIADGLDADAAVAADPLATLNEQWGGGFINAERMVRIVHADLSKS